MSETNPEQEKAMPYFAFLKPGTSAEKAIMVRLPENMYETSVDSIINYALAKDGMNRDEDRIAERVRSEMGSQYSIRLNGTKVGLGQQVAFQEDAFVEGAERLPYMKAEIVVFADHDGGLEYLL